MKRRVAIVSIAGALGIAACATPNSNPVAEGASNADRRVAEEVKVYREVTTDTEPVFEKCGDLHVGFSGVPVDLVSHVNTVSQYTYSTPIYSCETTDGDGKGDWKGFYDQSGDKAEQLKNAIKGIGYHPEKPQGHQGVAPLLVPYFSGQPKPRSWSAFSARITSAAQEIQKNTGLDASWTNNVLVQNKTENMQNLGYASVTGCSIDHYETKTYETRVEDSERPTTMHVIASGSGGELLPGECEKFSVSYNGSEINGTVTTSSNKYTYVARYATSSTSPYYKDGAIEFQGARIQADAPFLIEGPSKSAPISQNGGAATITLNHPDLHALAAVPEFARECKVTAQGVFYAKKGNGANGKTDKSSTKTVNVAVDMNSDTTALAVDGIQIKDPKKQHIGATVYQVMGSGCPFYAPSTKKVGIWD